MSIKTFELEHTDIKSAKTHVKDMLSTGEINVPHLSEDIIRNRWRAYKKSMKPMNLDKETHDLIKAALEAIVKSDILMDQRDVYYAIRGQHADWKISGHELKTKEAYDQFVGPIMEKLQLSTGFTMQSLGVRAGPRGFVTGDDESFFKLPDGLKIKISASPALKFNLVDTGVEFFTKARKLIHYEKSAGMDALLISDMPTMLEAVFMTSQGYNVETATKLHRDMEERGLSLYVLGDADPHGQSILHMYGRGSKSNSYMPECFYPTNATILGLMPRVAKELGLPNEEVNETHMRVVDNLEKLVSELHPEMMGDVEILRNEKKQWEWQALKGIDDYAPAIYMIEALRASGNEIKYVPKADATKQAMIDSIHDEANAMIENELDRIATEKTKDSKEKIKEQLRTLLSDKIDHFNDCVEDQVKRLETLSPETYRESVKQRLVDQPKQYWGDGARKVVNEMMRNTYFNLNAEVEATVKVSNVDVNSNSNIADPVYPQVPLIKDDIVASIEKRVTGKKNLILKLRNAIEKSMGKPSQVW